MKRRRSECVWLFEPTLASIIFPCLLRIFGTVFWWIGGRGAVVVFLRLPRRCRERGDCDGSIEPTREKVRVKMSDVVVLEFISVPTFVLSLEDLLEIFVELFDLLPTLSLAIRISILQYAALSSCTLLM